MTKKELRQKIKEFIASKSDDFMVELYCTPRDEAEDVIEQFAKFIDLDLKEEA